MDRFEEALHDIEHAVTASKKDVNDDKYKTLLNDKNLRQIVNEDLITGDHTKYTYFEPFNITRQRNLIVSNVYLFYIRMSV